MTSRERERPSRVNLAVPSGLPPRSEEEEGDKEMWEEEEDGRRAPLSGWEALVSPLGSRRALTVGPGVPPLAPSVCYTCTPRPCI